MPALQVKDPANKDFHPLDYLIILAKHSRLIIFTSLGMTLLTYIILVCLPNKYTATTRLLPPQQNLTLSGQLLEIMGGGVTPGKSNIGGNLGNLASGLLGLKSPNALYISVLTSNTVFDRIISRFDLRKLYRTKYIEDTRKNLSRVTLIEEDRKDGLISVTVTDKDPQRAAAIANAFREELDSLLRQLTAREAKDRLLFLEKERLQASINLTKAEDAMRAFSEKNSVIQIDAQAKGALEYIAKLRAQIDAKEVQIKVLRQQAAPWNYDVIRLQTELKGLRERLQASEASFDQSCVGDVCLSTSKVPALGLEYLRLYREAKFQEALFQLYCKLVELARLDEMRDVNVVQVVDPAAPPEKKSNQRVLPSLMAGMVTFFLMIFVVFGREYAKQVKQKADVAQRLEVLGSHLHPWSQPLEKIKLLLRIKKTG